jgi:dephospho-CoA kinase
MKMIGITGGIASGKSTVSNYLTSLGANVVCADEITHQLYNPSKKGSLAISEHFGKEYLLKDGSVDRKKLGALVFSDGTQLLKLNAIMHPLIFEAIFGAVDKNKAFAFIDAAVLIESGLYKMVDDVWLVTADEDIRIKRLMRRDEISYIQAKHRIDAQMSDQEKMKHASVVIENNQSIEKMLEKVNILLRKELSG